LFGFVMGHGKKSSVASRESSGAPPANVSQARGPGVRPTSIADLLSCLRADGFNDL
jgi:hypothetical protein